MKNISRREGNLGYAAGGAVLLFLGATGARFLLAHVGPDLLGARVPEKFGQSMRESYAMAATFLIAGACLFWTAVRRWKERNELEASYERHITNPDNVQSLRQHPDLYRKDYRAWIQEEHPGLLPQGDTPPAQPAAAAGPSSADSSCPASSPPHTRASAIKDWAWIIGGLLLFAGVPVWFILAGEGYDPSAILPCLRLVASGACVLAAALATKLNKPGWLAAFALAALLISPIIGPGGLTGAAWVLTDCAVSALLMACIAVVGPRIPAVWRLFRASGRRTSETTQTPYTPCYTPLKDACWSSTEVRTEAMRPLIAAFQGWPEWDRSHEKWTLQQIAILTVRRIIAEMHNLPQEARNQCRDAHDTNTALEAAHAAKVSGKNGKWCDDPDANAEAKFAAWQAADAASWAAAEAPWGPSRAAYTTFEAASAAAAAARAARAGKANPDDILRAACQLWIEAATCRVWPEPPREA